MYYWFWSRVFAGGDYSKPYYNTLDNSNSADHLRILASKQKNSGEARLSGRLFGRRKPGRLDENIETVAGFADCLPNLYL